MSLEPRPRYAQAWQAARQTRVKASGMTTLLQKVDAQWRGRDQLAPSAAEAARRVRELRSALARVQRLAARHDRAYDAAEKAVLARFFDDMQQELAWWQAHRRGRVQALGKALGALPGRLAALGADVMSALRFTLRRATARA